MSISALGQGLAQNQKISKPPKVSTFYASGQVLNFDNGHRFEPLGGAFDPKPKESL